MSVDVDTAQKGRSVREQPHYVISVGRVTFGSYLSTYNNFAIWNYFSYTSSVVITADSHLVDVGFETRHGEETVQAVIRHWIWLMPLC